MYSRDETVDAVLRLYQEITRHPYLNNSALNVPPPDGWNSIDIIQKKNDTVLDLLCHLPYLRSDNSSKQLLIYWETIPICYSSNQFSEEGYPLPAHCVYLTRSVDREGISLILDTNEGTITEFSHTGSHITVPHGDYEALPEAEKWRAHRTTLITEFMDNWRQKYEKLVWMLVPNPIGQPTTGRFYSRAESNEEEERIMHQGRREQWHLPDDSSSDDGENELDRSQRKARRRERRHAAVGSEFSPLMLRLRELI